MDTISFFLCALFTLSCNDAWEELQESYPANDELNSSNTMDVSIFDHAARKGAIENVHGKVNDKGIILIGARRSNPNVFVPWSKVDVCAQTLWCPERDTNLWLNPLNIEITFSDTNREILRMCQKNEARILTPKVYRELKYGNIPLEDAATNEKLDLFAMGCSETSYY